MTKERLTTPLDKEVFFQDLFIGFDHDGVMSNSREAAVAEYNNQFGTNRTVDDIHGYNALADWAKEDLRVSDEVAQEIHDWLWYKRPDVLLKAPPMPGAVEITKELASRGKGFVVITSRPYNYRRSTVKWYARHMPWVDENQIFIRGKNEVLHKDIYKVWMINALGVDAFFEDALHHTANILNYTDAMVILLNNNPAHHIYNQDRLYKIKSLVHHLPTIAEAQQQLFGA